MKKYEASGYAGSWMDVQNRPTPGLWWLFGGMLVVGAIVWVVVFLTIATR